MRTPKTLNEAIRAGLIEAMSERETAYVNDDRRDIFADEIVEKTVRDYLSQKFTAASIGELSLEQLWENITGRKFGV